MEHTIPRECGVFHLSRGNQTLGRCLEANRDTLRDDLLLGALRMHIPDTVEHNICFPWRQIPDVNHYGGSG